jgi:hypothetical protein
MVVRTCSRHSACQPSNIRVPSVRKTRDLRAKWAGSPVRGQQQERMFFFEKKNQKTFICFRIINQW